jgi:hypothetical protein
MNFTVISQSSRKYRFGSWPLLVLMVLLSATAWAQSTDPQAYVVTFNGEFGSVDLATGAFRQIGSDTPGIMADLVWSNGTLYSLVTSGDNAGSLAKIDPATGQVTIVGQTGLGYNAFTLGSVGGKLYLTDFNIGGGFQNLYSVNPISGSATLIGQTHIPADSVAPFTPNENGWINLCDETMYGTDGKLYVTYDSYSTDPSPSSPTYLETNMHIAPVLYEVDPTSAATAQVGDTSAYLDALTAVDGNVVAFKVLVINWNKFGPHARTQLLALDITSGQVTPAQRGAAPLYFDAAAQGIFGAAPIVP